MKIEVDGKEFRAIRRALDDYEEFLKEAVEWHDNAWDRNKLRIVQQLRRRLPARISPIPALHENIIV